MAQAIFKNEAAEAVGMVLLAGLWMNPSKAMRIRDIVLFVFLQRDAIAAFAFQAQVYACVLD
jgi:hypothetical protein